MSIPKQFFSLAALAMVTCVSGVQAQEAAEGQANAGRGTAAVMGPIQTEQYRATFVKLGSNNAEGLLYEPTMPVPNARIALVFTFPRATFDAVPAIELASRGYRVLWVTPFTEDESPMDGVAETSGGVKYMRTLPGVERVVVMSHSGGGRMMAFYTNLALNGPSACQGPEMIYPCKTEQASGLAKPDGLVLLDSAPGALNTASSVDPAYDGDQRSKTDLDMYTAANGFDAGPGSARYSEEFRKRFYVAQSTRNMQLIDNAVARLKLIEQGKGQYRDDEPLVIKGAVNGGTGATLFNTDLSLLSHTKKPHTLLKADGSSPEVVVRSIRAATGKQDVRNLNSVCCSSLNYTVKHFLANDALRTTKDFAITEDDIVGVDWKSAMRSTPDSAEGITVPTLIMTMTCFHLVVPDEIIYDHLAARDKTFAAVEGALHGFTPCKPEFGDTKKRTFDFVANWLAKPGRF